MKVGITGSSGFVGKHLFEFLKKSSFEVISIYLRESTNIPKDLDVLIHLAAKSEDKNISEEESTEYYKVNVELTKKVFKQFLESDAKDFIFFSTIKVVADSSEQLLTEDSICQPSSFYGKSKLEAEKYLLNQHLPIGKRLFILRPVAIYGPGTTDNISKLFKLVKKGLPWPFVAYENKRSFLYIANLNYSIAHIIEKQNVPSGVYHVSDDEVVSVNQLLEIMARVVNKKMFFIKIPQSVFKFLANIGDKLNLPFNNEMLGKLTNNNYTSNNKLKKALNIEHMSYSIQQGIEDTIKSFRK